MIPRASLNAVSFTLQGMGPILHNGSGEVNDLKKLITELEEMQCVGISERLRDWCSSKEKATRLNPQRTKKVGKRRARIHTKKRQ